MLKPAADMRQRLILLAFVADRRCDPVRNGPDVHHDRDPVNREKEETETSRPGRNQEGETNRHRCADEDQQDADQSVTFIYMPESRDDAEHDGDHVARFAFRGLEQSGRGRGRGERFFGRFGAGRVCIFQSKLSARSVSSERAFVKALFARLSPNDGGKR